MTRTHRRQALTMALYTFLLALGAAMPVLASFQPGLSEASPGRVRCGGYRAPAGVERGDEEPAQQPPRRRRASVAPEARSPARATSPSRLAATHGAPSVGRACSGAVSLEAS